MDNEHNYTDNYYKHDTMQDEYIHYIIGIVGRSSKVTLGKLNDDMYISDQPCHVQDAFL